MGEAPQLIVRTGSAEGRVTVQNRLFVGRECAGIDPQHRLIVDDPRVSRTHLEIRIEPDGSATVFDTSSNGTLLNGAPVERAIAIPLSEGDRLQVGPAELVFRAGRTGEHKTRRVKTTMVHNPSGRMALVAGDIIGFSETAQLFDSLTIATSLDRLFGELRSSVRAHRGMLSHLAGDALFAVWAVGDDSAGAGAALDFAIEAREIVERVAPELPLRRPDGSPLQMGWGVTLGEVALSAFTGGRSTVLGDPANVAFRLACIAGRDGHAEILVASEIGELAGDRLASASAAPMPVKGRAAPVNVLAIRAE